MKISAKNIIPGIKLERPVLNKNGLVMLGADTELTEILVKKIQKMDIHVVYVHGTSEALPPLDEVLARLEGRFRNVETAPHMDVLKKLLREHIEGLYEANGSENPEK
jgi:hypothetical protein